MLRGFYVLLLAWLAGCAQHPPLDPAKDVDLERYMGRWYALEAIPTSFERGCNCTTADYALREDGRIAVLNRCWRDGEWDTAEGVAWPRVADSTSQLEVSFFGPFYGEYTILYVEADYSYALVGTTDRDMLWLLSRSPRGDKGMIRKLEERAARQGFDVSRLRPVPDNCPERP